MDFGFGYLGTALVMGIAATGSAIGIGAAGQAAIGAWKKCYMVNKVAPFILTVFAGAPLTQTIYGFLLMQQMKSSTADPAFLLGLGISAGVAMALSAVAQGKAG
ncbi:MAG: V-type ATP synthase subunit K, partial [Oscillospiraceae bacterium]|nr:V-type ATP synthase subunit K [Oscillospiraceae bacterium]